MQKIIGKVAVMALFFVSTDFAQSAGAISGTVVLDEDSQPLRGADVVAVPQDPAVGTVGATAVSDATGSYTISGLKDAAYKVCAIVRGSDLLQPCDWGGGELAMIQAGGMTTVQLRIKRGRTLEIRVADPSRVLETHEKRGTGVHFLAGVWDQGTFHPAKTLSTHPSARVYSVVVPFDREVMLSVKGQKIRAQDGGGRPVTATSAPIAVKEPPSSNRESRKFDYLIIGREP